VLAHYRSILGLHQTIIIGVGRSAFGEADQELVKEIDYRLIDEFGAIVGMKAPHDKGKAIQHGLHYRHQVTLRYLFHRGYNLPLRDLVHGIDMVHTLLSTQVSLVNSVDSNITRAPSRSRSRPFADFHDCRFGSGISFGDAPIEVASPQIVEVGNRYPADILEVRMPINCPFPLHNLFGGWTAQIVMQFVSPG